ncbi:MAG TPA: hypothetical protein VLA96_13345 [Terriglobales bacterium]|jgi:hypothetical protein|nr:hypothetical protein [Terriglobales bacterium]
MNPWLIFTLAAFAAAVLYAAARALHTYYHWRGTRLVVCPETRDYASVTINAKQAALKSLEGKNYLRLEDCNRWQEREKCAEPCLNQIVESADGCLVRTYVDNFYRGKHCAICRKPFLDVGWTEHLPAAIDDNGNTVTWDRVPVPQLPKFLTSHMPVCWDCHVAATFRRQHSDMVTDRPWQH